MVRVSLSVRPALTTLPAVARPRLLLVAALMLLALAGCGRKSDTLEVPPEAPAPAQGTSP